jgi:hypothetical protein
MTIIRSTDLTSISFGVMNVVSCLNLFCAAATMFGDGLLACVLKGEPAHVD